MIEVIYDKSKEKQDENSKEKEKDSAGVTSLKLPKNIRQIGAPPSGKKIYIEDYVVTYLNYISRPGSTSARGAILLGEYKRTEMGDIIFISGAVDAENLEFDMDESEFTKEAWSEIYEQLKEYFPELSVVGWFLSRMGFSTAINDKIEKMHVENFPGKDKVLYVMDSLEGEDAFYMYDKGQLVKQKGYYIYYTKNEAMQEYIVKRRGGMPEETNTEIHRKDEELIRNFRERNPIKKVTPDKPAISLAYVAASFLVLTMLVMAVTVISNNDKMKEMEVSLNRLELTAESTSDQLANAMADSNAPGATTAQDADIVPPTTENEVSTEQNSEESSLSTEGTTEEPTEQQSSTTEDTEDDVTSEDTISTEQTLPTITDGNPTYYTIKYGDSLSSISEAFFGSVFYADDIAEANNMGIDDKIYEGQSIIIPSIKLEKEE